MSAYRVHERDPIVFASGMRLVWRNSEDPLECPFTWPWPPAGANSAGSLLREVGDDVSHTKTRRHKDRAGTGAQLIPVDVEFLVWTYEWPATVPA